MASHYTPSTITQKAAELNNLVAHMKSIDDTLANFVNIMTQVNADGNLDTVYGYAVLADAQRALAVFTALKAELDAAVWWNTAIAEMG